MKRTKQENNAPQSTAPRQAVHYRKLFIALGAAVLLFALNYWFAFPEPAKLWTAKLSKAGVFGLNFLLNFGLFAVIFFHEKKGFQQADKYFFLLLLLVEIFAGLLIYGDFFLGNNQVLTRLILLQKLSILPGIVAGSFAVYQRKDTLNATTLPPEKASKSTQLLYAAALLLVIGLAAALFFYRLDYFDLYSDEAQVTEGAVGYYHTGEFKRWDFVKDKLQAETYDRGFPHLFLVAQAYKIFGITPWAGRFVSVFFGLIFIGLIYLVAHYFLRNRAIALLTSLVAVFYPEFLLLIRWTRMYAMLMPVYLLLFYFSVKLLTEPSKSNFILTNKFLSTYANFRYLWLIPILLLLPLCYFLHINSLFILLLLWLFSILAFFIFKEKKYLFLSLIGGVFFAAGVLFAGFNGLINKYFSFFESNNTESYQFLLAGYPFDLETNLILLGTGLSVFFLLKDKLLRKKILFLYLSLLITYIIFAYIIHYSISFRYICFVSAPVIILIINNLQIIARALFHKITQIVLFLLIALSALLHLNVKYENLYVENSISPAYPSIAFRDILENHKAGELIYHHWVPMIYLDEVDTSITEKMIAHYGSYPFSEVYETLQQYPSGWLTWHTFYEHRIDSLVKAYASMNFIKYRGQGIDNSGVEVYRYDQSMLQDSAVFKKSQGIPVANFNMQKAYSVAFWASLPTDFASSEVLFHIRNTQNNKLLLTAQSDSSNGKRMQILYPEAGTSLQTKTLSDGQLHHVVWTQTGGNPGDTCCLFIDGKKEMQQILGKDVGKLAKFRINLKFKGFITDIQIYDFPLKEYLLPQIMLNKNVRNFKELTFEKEKYQFLHRWLR